MRIVLQRRPFQKGYIGNWSEESFVVDGQMPTQPVTYKLKDLASDDKKRMFYSDELQIVSMSDDTLYDITEQVAQLSLMLSRPFQGQFIICRLGLAIFNPHTKFKVSTITCEDPFVSPAICKRFLAYSTGTSSWVGQVSQGHMCDIVAWESRQR